MILELVQPSRLHCDQVELIQYQSRSIVDWMLNRPKQQVSAQYIPGRIHITRCLIKSIGEELELGTKFVHTFEDVCYVGIMPICILPSSLYSDPKLFVYECTVDNLVSIAA